MKVYQNPSQNDWSELLKRPTDSIADLQNTVTDIFKEVQQKGD